MFSTRYMNIPHIRLHLFYPKFKENYPGENLANKVILTALVVHGKGVIEHKYAVITNIIQKLFG